MAILKKKYHSLNETLQCLRLQIEESKNFAFKFCPKFSNPISLFLWLKPLLHYKNDPKQTELLQSFPTLIKKNFYGISGAGDCDCFTIAAVSACIVQNWPDAKIYIKLVGRNKNHPSHIYSGVDLKGKEFNLDLTNKRPLIERPYPYKQKIYLQNLQN